MTNDNEYSNVVDNLSLLIKPVGACRLTEEQQLEALEDAIGCSDGQDWQDQTWVERLIELIDRPTCKNAKLYKDVFECSECHCSLELITEVCNEYGEPFSVPFMPTFCPGCGAEVQE